ncbi:MAG: glucosidase [Verrucomicrobia bacterium]|nr:glucosidase [Verrucomicrobiota bacterium]
MNREPSFDSILLSRGDQTAEARRLAEDGRREKNWKRWGPYLSERQWSTVREDYSEHGECWDYFPHDHARSRAYRWGEDGLLGFTDRECRLCFALALWNGRDPILKERLFGLTGGEGNHGEDVKEEYFYLDSTPTHSYAKALYKYPQAEFPYARLLDENKRRGKNEGEFELADTGVFDESRYFDVFAEYAKNAPDDLLIRITVANRGPEAATLHLLPTLWFRNTWSWGCSHEGCSLKPRIELGQDGRLTLTHETLGKYFCEIGPAPDGSKPTVLFTDNESNAERLWSAPNANPFVKDAFHEFVIHGRADAVNAKGYGTKAAPLYVLTLKPGESQVIRLRLVAEPATAAPPSPEGLNVNSPGRSPGKSAAKDQANPGGVQFDPSGVAVHSSGQPRVAPEATQIGSLREPAAFDKIFTTRLREADEFFTSINPRELSIEEANVVRQGYAGLLWSKQFYHYVVNDWLKGDPGAPTPPVPRATGRNSEWKHLYSRDIISMPDKWEYPWFAAWDLAFHMIPFARLDGEFAKQQLTLFLREWYMHPNGQIPAYEFAFGDVNPPVHAWAAWRVYKITGRDGQRDRDFLEGVFQKLLLNFTWWVNRKDANGKNLFSGGFLGLDNIGVFDRSKPLPTGGTLSQADGTAWMGFYCGTMLNMALELAHDGERAHPAYEDMASKFLEHFIQIVDAMNGLGGTGLWDEADGFYYDQIQFDHHATPLKTRSMVGLLPLIAVEVLDEQRVKRLPGFKKRLDWFLKNRADLGHHIAMCECGHQNLMLLAIPSRERLERTLRYLLDETEFLSPHGLRSVSKFHEKNPFVLEVEGERHVVDYVPGESNTWLFGGNSNWRGPVWFPVNYLLLEALERYHHFYGEDFKVECPTGSGTKLNLQQVAHELERRLASLFLPDAQGRRPCHGDDARFANDPHWKNLLLFHEYFHGENGRGIGASHQTGWTALVIRCVKSAARNRTRHAPTTTTPAPQAR